MEDRIRRLVLGVAKEALRESGARGLVLADLPGPESRLLTRWCADGGVELREPDQEVVRTLTGALPPEEPAVPDPERAGLEARRAAARLRAAAEDLIPVSGVNRTALLLSPLPPPEPFLPLADVPGSVVLSLMDHCTLPAPFRDLARDREALVAAEEILEDIRRRGAGHRGRGPAHELRRRLEAAVAAGAWWRKVPPLVPKLGPGTWGIDLDL